MHRSLHSVFHLSAPIAAIAFAAAMLVGKRVPLNRFAPCLVLCDFGIARTVHFRTLGTRLARRRFCRARSATAVDNVATTFFFCEVLVNAHRRQPVTRSEHLTLQLRALVV